MSASDFRVFEPLYENNDFIIENTHVIDQLIREQPPLEEN